MTNQQLIETRGATQVPFQRKDGQTHPTPTEIRMAIWEALAADSKDPQTPPVPVHVMGLIRSAVSAACEGKYQ